MKSLKRRLDHKSLVALLFALLALVTGAGAAERPPIVGVIRGADGQPLPDARVFIYTGKPRLALVLLVRRAIPIAASALALVRRVNSKFRPSIRN